MARAHQPFAVGQSGSGDLMKACPACKAEKPLDDFGKDKVRKDGLNVYCKPCARLQVKKAMAGYRERNPGKETMRMATMRSFPGFRENERARARELYQENLDVERKRKREWRRANPDTARRYNKAKPETMAAVKARYRAAMINAMPSWADQQAIRSVYAEARRKSRQDNIVYHVDHIVPLQGVNVCGLHVHWNLQVLDAFSNRSKGNRLIF